MEGVRVEELPPLVDQGDDRFGENDQADRGWKRQENRQTHRLGEGGSETTHVSKSRCPGDNGKRYRGHGHAEDTQRQLHEAEGIGEPADGAISQVGGEDAIHHDVDLDGARRDDGRKHEDQHPPDAGIAPVEIHHEAESRLPEPRQLDAELKESAEQGPEGETDQGPFTKGRIDQPSEGDTPGDGSDVEETRGQGGSGEAIDRIEHAHHQGGQGDQQDEGIHDPGKLDREGGFLGRESGCKKADQLRGEDHPEQGEQTHENRGKGRHLGGQLPSRPLPLGGNTLGENGHKRRGEGPFRKEIAEQIGGPEGGQEGIHATPRPEESSKDQLTGQTE